eukprot:8879127-Alexandrium_andersonii.AAC.1
MEQQVRAGTFDMDQPAEWAEVCSKDPQASHARGRVLVGIKGAESAPERKNRLVALGDRLLSKAGSTDREEGLFGAPASLGA